MAVRNERVILSLQDDFSGGMARAAATTALLNRELGTLSGQELKAARSSQMFVRDVQQMGRESDGAGKSIDRLSGRVGILADLLLTLGPATLPIGAVAVPAITALTSSIGFAVVAAGSAVIAFQGVGEALETLNKAQLEPTEANLKAAEDAMKRISPVARDMVEQLDSLGGLGKELRDAGAEELFPGVIEALDTIVGRGPEVERIIRAVNSELGDIAADSAASLNSKRWDDFFGMIEAEAPDALDAMADSLGNVVHGLSEIIEAFVPLNRDGMDWLVRATEGFDKWATGLKKTEGFKDFVDYVRENGPRVAETAGAVATAIVDIAQAAAPLGGPALQAIESMAEAVSAIADSDFATPLLAAVAAMRTINRLAPLTAGSLAIMGGGAAGGKGGKTGKPGKGGKPGRPGMTPGVGIGALIGADILAAELGWEEASARQVERGQAFSEKWGRSWSDAAEEARVKLSDVLDVAYGTGPFGLKANDRGLTDALLTQPVEKQIRLQKQLREEYGLGFKALEARGVLVEGFTEQFRRQRQAVSPLAEDIRRLGQMKAHPEVDLDDKAARQKQRENRDWLTNFGREKRSATVDLLDTSRRKKSREADDWITAWGDKNAAATVDANPTPALDVFGRVRAQLAGIDRTDATPTVDANAEPALDIFGRVRAQLAGLDGTVATTYVNTVRTVTGPRGAAIFGSARGSTVPDAPGPYRDQFLYALAQREEVVSNDRGQADRHRPVLKAINADLPRHIIRGMLAAGGTAGDRRKRNFDESEGGETEAQRERREAREAREEARAENRANRQERDRQDAEERQEQAREAAEERAEHESKMFLAAIEGQERAARGLIDAAQTQKQSAESVRDGWAQAMQRAGSAATAGFQSSLFGSQQHGLWSGPGGSAGSSWRDALSGDIAGLQERRSLVQMLAAQGIKGSALEALLGQGNNDQVRALIESGDAGEFAAMFAQREALTASTSQGVGQAAWGQQYALAASQVAFYDARIAALEAELTAISGQRPITVNESVNAQATAAEIARLQAIYGAA